MGGTLACSPGISARKGNASAKKKRKSRRRRTSHEHSGNDYSDYMHNIDYAGTDRKEAVMK